ncbi:MAG: DNA-processing protein DprA [Flavobacteriaceae bacterium]|nr:DNA-processing protein DprA [Flavobacteriaceae bacterium]
MQLSESELLHILALMKAKNIGPISAKKLLQAVGSAEALFKEKKANLLKIKGVSPAKLKDLFEPNLMILAEKELKFIENNAIQILYYRSEAYPYLLKQCIDSPLILFQKGTHRWNQMKSLSIVGTRKMTRMGADFLEKLFETLSALPVLIVSGFAAGVDIKAHRLAIEYNLPTVAVLAHGLNQYYPTNHKAYAANLMQSGAFISDFFTSDEFNRENFLSRNRIIAGLSEATLVVESAEKGGSLVTAQMAFDYNRQVFAVPGRTTDLYSTGCNNLIKQQKAALVESAADIIYQLGWDIEEKPKPIQQQLFVELTEPEERLINTLKETQKEHIDVLVRQSGISAREVAGLLLSLELKGLVRPLPGKFFELI